MEIFPSLVLVLPRSLSGHKDGGLFARADWSPTSSERLLAFVGVAPCKGLISTGSVDGVGIGA